MSENIFDVVNEETNVTIDDSVDYYDTLVGEGKKFRDERALARGKAEADRFIETLKAELANTKKELNTRASFESILDQIKGSKETNVEPVQPATPGGQNQVQLDDSTLEAKLAEILSKREAQKSQESNLAKAVRVVKDQYGDQAQVVINHKASELGMTPAALQDIATKSPSAFFRLIGVSENPAPGLAPAVPRNGLNTVSQLNTGFKNKAYYDRMKVTDPKRYNDPKTTSEMMKSLAECRSKGIPWE